ncbi:hypothetical protein [Shewanella aestuarii]|uniref:Uncharacterized protein n=1 Tax=Shewanella aestuarii TaxID=1028752 RepID=A0A6G9QPZ7_9GAMM|nr:hypothetical protein [Shewanella aestuarii]QIR16542.1 hypothetical protein HBH39_18885 [Shewanella aestuarii]
MSVKLKISLLLLAFMTSGSFAQDPQEIANREAEFAATNLKQYKEAAIAVYQTTGFWPTSVTNLNSKMPVVPKFTGAYKSPSIVHNANGSVSITIQAGSAQEAKRLAGLAGEVYSINGSTVSLLVTPPAGSNLRSVYKDQIVTTNQNEFSVIDDISLGGNKILNAQSIDVNTANLKCLTLGSSKICENTSGILDVTTDLASIAGTGQVDETITAGVVEVLNKLKTNEMSLSELAATNTVVTDLIVTAANLDQAQINLMDAITATMKDVLVGELTVTGSSKLADLLATDGSLATITGKDLNVSGVAVMNTLQANGLLAGNAFVDAANVQNLITNVGSITNLKTNLMETNRILAEQGLLADIKAITADFNSATIEDGDAVTLNAQSFKGKIVQLGAAVVNATLTVNQLDVNRIESDTANIKSLQTETGTIKTLNANTTTVTGDTKTASLEVAGDASFGANLTVNNAVSTKDLVTNNLNVTNLIEMMDLVVENSMLTAYLNGLNSTITADKISYWAGTGPAHRVTSDRFVSDSIKINNGTFYADDASIETVTAGDLRVSSMSEYGTYGSQKASGTLTAASVNVRGITTANEVDADVMTATTMNSTDWQSTTLNAKSLITQYNAALAKAVIQNMTATNSAIGTATGESLALTGDLSANSGSLQTVRVTAQALLGSLESGPAEMQGNLSVANNVKTANLTANTINATQSSITTLKAQDITVNGLLKGATVKTNAGNSLASVNNLYINHEGRIISVEQFRTECINNWVYACAGTLPRLSNTNCVGCTQSSYSSGSFNATASATILDCPAGCDYTWTTGSGIAKATCSNGSVGSGQTKTVSCSVSSSPAVSINSTLSSVINLEVKHSGRASINAGNSYPISWTFTGETPTISSASCPECSFTKNNISTFTALYTANIANCSAGCNYQWVFGSGIAADICTNGSVAAGQTKGVSCKIKASPGVNAGTVLNSTLKLVVMNAQSASQTASNTQTVRWENQKITPEPTITYTSCKFVNNGGACSSPGVGSGGYLDVMVTYTISNCDPSCTLTTTLGSGLTPVTCSTQTVTGNTTATCRFRNTNPLSLGQSLTTTIAKAKVVNNDDATKTSEVTAIPLQLQNGTAPVAAPSVTLGCTGCSQSVEAKSSFTATANGSITTCDGGCTYTWALGGGLTKNICNNGSVNSGGSSSPSCSFKNTSAVAEGTTLASTVSLTATNIGDTSKKTTKSFSVTWENIKPAPAKGFWSGNPFTTIYSTIYFSSNCPSPVFTDLDGKGYKTEQQQVPKQTTEECNIGDTWRSFRLEYAGNGCRGHIQEQVCK